MRGVTTTTRQSPRKGPGFLLVIAVFKLIKAALLVALGIAALSLAHDDRVLTAARHALAALGAHGHWVDRAVGKVLGIDHRHLRALGIGTFVYAGVFVIEGTGLLLRKTWAEYLTTGITASFIPLEVYEMVHAPSALKAVGVAVNLLIVAYLVVRLIRERRVATAR